VKEKKVKDGASGKRASGRSASYAAFMAEARPKIKAEHPKWKAQQVSKEGGRQWKALSEAEKSAYDGKVTTKAE
jgi:hypothetical protein